MGSITREWAAGRSTTLKVYQAGGPAILLAHGAGTDQSHPHVTLLARALQDLGRTVVTFDYPYRAEGRKPPDRMPVLLECHRRVAAFVRQDLSPELLLAGRSMGGRVSTMLAADGDPCRAVIAYGYPLHPAGRPDKLRIDHLAAVGSPMLFVRGSRDALSRSDLFDRHVRSLSHATVVDLDGADHSFRLPRTSPEEVAHLLARVTEEWIGEVGPFALGPAGQS